MNVGRAAMGTMTTTPAAGLFRRIRGAVDGFHGPGHSCMEHFELQVCGLEIIDTIVGLLDTGLVTVAPAYSRYQGYLLTRGKLLYVETVTAVPG